MEGLYEKPEEDILDKTYRLQEFLQKEIQQDNPGTKIEAEIDYDDVLETFILTFRIKDTNNYGGALSYNSFEEIQGAVVDQKYLPVLRATEDAFDKGVGR